MPLPKDKAIISVVVDKDVKELLDKYAAELDISVSRFARNLIYIGLDDFKLLKKTGLLKIVLSFKNIFSDLKKRMEIIEKEKGN